MNAYRFTDQSQQDLIKLRRFTVEHWGVEQSTTFLSDLKKTLHLLSEMPFMGMNCLDDLGKHVYRFPFGSHIIYYLIMADHEIVIVAILHQSMAPENHLGSRLS